MPRTQSNEALMFQFLEEELQARVNEGIPAVVAAIKDAGHESEDAQLLSRYYLLFKQLLDDLDKQVFSKQPADDESDEGKARPVLSQDAKDFLKLFKALFKISVDTLFNTQIDALNSFVTDYAEAITTIRELKPLFDALITRALISIVNTPVPQA